MSTTLMSLARSSSRGFARWPPGVDFLFRSLMFSGWPTLIVENLVKYMPSQSTLPPWPQRTHSWPMSPGRTAELRVVRSYRLTHCRCYLLLLSYQAGIVSRSATDREAGRQHGFGDLALECLIPGRADRGWPGLRGVIARRGDCQDLADRPDPEGGPVSLDYLFTSVSRVRLDPEESRGALEDLVGPAEFAVLPLESRIRTRSSVVHGLGRQPRVRSDRGDQRRPARRRPVLRWRRPDPFARVDEFAQPKVLGQGGRQEKAGIGHRAVVVEGHIESVEAVR